MSESQLQLAGSGDLVGLSGLTQSPLTHVCPAHVFTDELGLSTKLLGEWGFQASARKGREGAAKRSGAWVPSCLIAPE